MQFSVFLVCTTLLAVCSAMNLPSYIKPCMKNDPEFAKCAIEHGNAIIPRIVQGDPMYGIPVMDPFRVAEVNSYKHPTMNLTTSEIVLYGLKDMKLKSFMMSEMSSNCTVFVKRLRMISKYTLSGKFREHDIEGSGETEIEFFDVNMPIYLQLGKSDKEMYRSVLECRAQVVPQKITFKVISFKGDQERVKLVEKSANENWSEMMPLVSSVVDKLMSFAVKRTAEAFFNNIPVNMIFL